MEAENALVKQSNQHPDGWGIGYFIQQDAYILKSGEPAHESERFRLASSRLQSHAFVVHVRRATVGAKDYMNSHPFRFGRWILAHNGTIFSFDLMKDWVIERIRPEQRPLIFGATDSEHLFHYLVSAMAERGVDPTGHKPIDAPVAAMALRDAVDALYIKSLEVAEDHPILNFILTNGETFFALRAGKELYLSTQKVFCPDAETCPEPNKVCLEAKRPGRQVNHLIVSSERIGNDDIWENMHQGQMVYLDREFRIGFLDAPPNFRLSKIAS
jgi:glutamine amidotransferase